MNAQPAGASHYWQKGIETLPRPELRHLQDRRLLRMLAWVAEHSQFYRDKFARSAADVGAVTGVDSLRQLPFTDRAEVHADQAGHTGIGTLRCVDESAAGQTIGLSGARFSVTGRQLRILVSATDAGTQGKLAARGLTAAGIGPADYLYVADHPQFSLLYMHVGLGSINVGAKSLLVGMERARRNVRVFMPLYPPTAFYTTPSYSRVLAGLLREAGARYPIRTVIGTGEPGCSLPGVRARMEGEWQSVSTADSVQVRDSYGLPELGLLGFECSARCGMHGFEDAYVYELIDPDSGEPAARGAEGELVVTHLERDGMPLIRYRTGDITRLDEAPCECGRTHVRLLGVRGRLAERLSVGARRLYPGSVEDALAGITAYGGEFNILVNGSASPAQLELALDAARLAPEAVAGIEAELGRRLQVPVRVRLAREPELLVFPHKSWRLIDAAQRNACAAEARRQARLEE